MLKSMTGFGRSEYNDEKRNIVAEIKSVNHRYSDISVKMPRRYSFAEERLKALIKDVARRGKIDLSLMVENLTEDDTNICLNPVVAKQYYDNLRKLQENFDLAGDITLQYLASLPDVMKAMPDVEDEEELFKSLSIPVMEAARRLDEMRMIEGAKLTEDIIKRGELIREKIQRIEKRAPAVVAAYAQKMKERINDLLGGTLVVPEDRILIEAAVFADKSNITEELVRLDSHILQLDRIIEESKEPDGKKLDFLVQEMNREANTIGSKANDAEITNLVLEIKSEIEKIREQVQNIE
ncbi:MAG: YicC family protein [Eubacteriales bacterium]|nr:YicC family protein [Eubacteriales bacterium]MDD3349892.1 YicC family protein [Eubacteriales bacterium]